MFEKKITNIGIYKKHAVYLGVAKHMDNVKQRNVPMSIDKEGNCLILKFLCHEKEMLELFQVEELEKRYEMGWAPSSGSVKGGANSNGLYVEGQANWTFK